MSRRIQKVNELVKRTLGKIILEEFHPKDTLVTITKVKTTSNLIKTKVFINIIPKEKEDEIIESLRKDVYHIQQKLNDKLKMGSVPKIIFKLDKSVEKTSKIRKLLSKLREK